MDRVTTTLQAVVHSQSSKNGVSEVQAVDRDEDTKTPTSNDVPICKVCYSNQMEIIILPCAHLLTCTSCSIKLSNCPICRSPNYWKPIQILFDSPDLFITAMADNSFAVPVASKKFSMKGLSGTRAVLQQQMKTQTNRVGTFSNWPIPTHLSPSIESLAAAGFFYRKMEDQVQCFQCSLVLSRWNKNLDPLTEHRRHSPNCEFVIGRDQELQISQKLASLCKICYINEMQIAFFPCTHLLACTSCSEKLSCCPICQSQIDVKFRTYISFE